MTTPFKPGTLVKATERAGGSSFWKTPNINDPRRHGRVRAGDVFLVLEDVSSGDLLHVVDRAGNVGFVPDSAGGGSTHGSEFWKAIT
jgi:hypothetical protein